MNGSIKLTVGGFGESGLLPSTAVYTRGGTSYILVVEDGKTKQLPALHAAAAEAAAALKQHQKFLEQELLPTANGEWRIGREKFNRKFELQTGAGVTADEIYADAQAEFARVRNDIVVDAEELKEQLPAPKVPLVRLVAEKK